jgi:hypothetical protein
MQSVHVSCSPWASCIHSNPSCRLARELACSRKPDGRSIMRRMRHLSGSSCGVTVLPWGMCGGLNAQCQLDGRCPSWCCSPGYFCSNVTQWYWQCQADASSWGNGGSSPSSKNSSTSSSANGTATGVASGAASSSRAAGLNAINTSAQSTGGWCRPARAYTHAEHICSQYGALSLAAGLITTPGRAFACMPLLLCVTLPAGSENPMAPLAASVTDHLTVVVLLCPCHGVQDSSTCMHACPAGEPLHSLCAAPQGLYQAAVVPSVARQQHSSTCMYCW